MNKIHVISSILLVVIIIGLFAFLNSSNSKTSISLPYIPSPTLNINQPLQFISPGQSQANQQQQQQAEAAQAQAQEQAQQQQQQSAENASQFQGPLAATVSATIKTSKGDISINLYADKAPKTVLNFISKAKSGFYKNLTFHRVEDWVVQGGDPLGNGTGGGQMAAEQTPDIPFVVGSIGVARGSDPTINNASQFFITKQNADWLNGQYTNFGIVTSGMDVVNKLKIGDKIEDITVDLSQTEGGLMQ